MVVHYKYYRVTLSTRVLSVAHFFSHDYHRNTGYRLGRPSGLFLYIHCIQPIPYSPTTPHVPT